MDPVDTLFILLSQGSLIPDSVLEEYDWRHRARMATLVQMTSRLANLCFPTCCCCSRWCRSWTELCPCSCSLVSEQKGVVAVICFMWGIEGVWKCSVVIKMDMEEEEALDMATALAWRMAWVYQAKQTVWSEGLLKVTARRPWSWWDAWLPLSSLVPLLTVVRMYHSISSWNKLKVRSNLPDGRGRCFLYPCGVHQSFWIKFALPGNQLNPWLFDKERPYFQPVTVLWQGGKKGRDLIKGEIVRDWGLVLATGKIKGRNHACYNVTCLLLIPCTLSHTQFTYTTCTYAGTYWHFLLWAL